MSKNTRFWLVEQREREARELQQLRTIKASLHQNQSK